MHMKVFGAILFFWGMMFAAVVAEPIKVVSLHSLVGDLLREVGAEKIEVIDLLGKNGDPHSFEPQAADLQAAEGAVIYFASGMGMETYLDKLRGILGGGVKIVEVGASLPGLPGICSSCGSEAEAHEAHAHSKDPHWWHSVELFSRGAAVVADALAEADRENADFYQQNALTYREELAGLDKWVRREVLKVKRADRHLATAHAAFQYFCNAYGFIGYTVQGMNREQMPDAVELAALIKKLKENEVRAVFPERESNPKMLHSLTADTGIRMGEALIADGVGVENYEAMIRQNVSRIVAGLSAK